MTTLIDIFNLGMQREYPEPIPDVDPTCELVLNLGPGNKHINGAHELEYPSWDAEKDAIPFPSNTVSQIHAYHFLEHITNIVPLMVDIRRVLIPGGHINIVVPYWFSSMAYTDLDHKRAFSEKVWRNLFTCDDYFKSKLNPMEVHTNFIIGDRLENLCLLTQLRKPK